MGPVRRRSNFVSITVFSVAWGLCVLFLALPFTASAAGVTYHTTRVGPASYAPNGVTSPITINVAPAGGVPRYQQIKPFVNPSTLSKFGRAAIRGGGVGIAVTAIVEGLGYLVDQATGEITKIEETVIPGTGEGSPFLVTLVQKSKCGSPADFATGYTHGYSFVNAPSSCGVDNAEDSYISRSWVCPPTRPFSINGPAGHSNSNGYCWISGNGDQIIEQEVPIDETDLAVIDPAIFNGLSLSQKSQVLQLAVTEANPRGSVDTSQYPVNPLTSPIVSVQTIFSDWPQLQSSFQSVLNAELAALLAAADPNFQPSTDEQTIINQGAGLPPPEAPTSELPAFCDWASFLCEPFIASEQPVVPVLDIETPTYDSGLPSSAACPAPYQVVTSFGTWDITFQFACDMATAIRTPLIAISYLMAGFIVVGVRR